MPFCHQNEYYFSCNHLLFSQWASDYVKSNESLFPKYYFIPLYINKWDGIGIRKLTGRRLGKWNSIDLPYHNEEHSEGLRVQSYRKMSRHKERAPGTLLSPGLQVKGGGYLLSRIALQYHRRKWA